MTEDKDLARATEIYNNLAQFYYFDEYTLSEKDEFIDMILKGLKEERRRLLNDPRIKNYMAYTKHTWHCLEASGKCFCSYEEALKGFESLLKENQ